MTTLIIGGNGFTGEWLIPILNKNNSLHIMDIHPVSKFKDVQNYYQTDLSDIDQLTRLLEHIKPKKIYFLAGIFGDFYLNRFIDVNVTTVANLLESILSLSLKTKFVFISSGAVYGMRKKSDLPLSENSVLKPQSNYGISKLLMENLVVNKLRGQDKISYLILRPSNLLGPGLSDKLLVGKIIKQLREQNSRPFKLSLFNTNGKRDYIDVRDAVDIYTQLMDSKLDNQTFNISTGELTSVSEIISKIEDILETQIIVKTTGKEDPEEFSAHSQDPTKLKKFVDYEIKFDIKDSLRDMLLGHKILDDE